MAGHRETAGILAVLGLCWLALQAVAGESDAQGPYQPEWPSLMTHSEAPDWFRDAKFGIYFHWGVYCVPAFGSEWYPRDMHLTGKPEYRHHVETYGEPSEFGYHDFVPMFKAEHFDPEAWADLFQKAGARFAGPVAEHHDGFSMWNSALTPWNVVNKGPHRDIMGELATAIRKHGMRLVVTFHHARNNQHMVNKGGNLVWEGHYPRVEGWPTVSEDPELRLLYGNIPRRQFLELWKGKLFEVIDNYQPDIIWFDSWLDEIDESCQTQFLAHYFNRASEWGKDVVVTCKQRDLPLEVAVEDFEKGRADQLTREAWLTDDTISYGSWCYTQDLKIKPTREVLHVLIDIVSKNGQLLLNISPKADGTIPEDQQQVLLGIGEWLGRFGEAIYGTRPFTVYGEGPTQMNKGGHFVKTDLGYGPQDIRYTRNGNTVYAIVLGWPGAGKEISMTSLGEKASDKPVKVTAVTLLGASESMKWKQKKDALAVTCPETSPDGLAIVFKIETGGL
ncbi:MAG TPA: alpha-L-fucosidase [Candidatus Hydrogenedentes bacterium]|nr:alpha-L-fucosidase [Candidatus Hydrogenedentota bacterium]